MSVSSVVKREVAQSRGKIKLVSIPVQDRPTFESIQKLEGKIASQITANEVMRSKSIYK